MIKETLIGYTNNNNIIITKSLEKTNFNKLSNKTLINYLVWIFLLPSIFLL